MPLPPRRLLAGSAVAGLLFLLPVGAPANAQDNRNTGGWVQTGGVVLSFIAAVGGATAVSAAVWRRLSKPGAEGKRDDDKLNALLARFDQLDSQLDSSVKEIDTELKRYINNGVNELTGTLGNKIDNLSDNLKTVNSENEKALNDLNEEVSVSLEQCEDEKESLKVSVEEKERRLEIQESNKDKQWKIMKDLCKNDKDNQKTSPIDYLKLIKVTKSIKCFDCLDAVGKLLPDSLEILPEAISSAKEFKDFNSEKIDQLFELLWKLGTSFRDEIKQTGGDQRAFQVAESVFGRKYSPQGKEYVICHEGKNFNMRQHLKIDSKGTKTHGTEKAPDNSCLRIHFAWHDESKKVLIGHCGRHR